MMAEKIVGRLFVRPSVRRPSAGSNIIFLTTGPIELTYLDRERK